MKDKYKKATKNLQTKYTTDGYVNEMLQLKRELKSNKETERPSIFNTKELSMMIQMLKEQDQQLQEQIKAREPKSVTEKNKPLNEDIKNALRNNKGGSIAKKRMGGTDYRKGGMVISSMNSKRNKG